MDKSDKNGRNRFEIAFHLLKKNIKSIIILKQYIKCS